ATPAVPFDLTFQNTLLLWKYFAYGQAILRNANGKFTSTLGLRYDGNSFLGKNYLAPRLSASYALTPTVSLNASYGVFNQSPEYLTMAISQNNTYVNQDLPYIHTSHYIGGAAWQARPSLRLSLEGFYKQYENYPVSEKSGISLANLGGDFGFVGAEAVSGIGKGRAYGLELFAQKKMVERLYGLASYALVWSEFTGKDGVFRPSSWDVRHAVSLTSGYRIGQKWEFGVKWRFTSGNPFTPFDLAKSAAEYKITGRGVQDFSKLNSLRMPAYHRLDFRVDRRFFFNKLNGVAYIDIQNLYNHDNLFTYTYTQDPAYPNNLRPSSQVSFLPNIGFSIEW
ncbi:MAG TPA: TonB-dependent receptor, partial [Rhodothermales bacterium]|nr:TonB-dependent receptor [Rhodothermales bacterium]